MSHFWPRFVFVTLGIVAVASWGVLLVVRPWSVPVPVLQSVTVKPVATALAESVATSAPVDDRLGFAESLGIRIIPLPEGVFLMGAADTELEAHPDQKPQHRVRIPAGRGLAVHEVTVGQFRRFVEETGYQTEAESKPQMGMVRDPQRNLVQDPHYSWKNPGFEQTDDHPGVNVSWNDDEAFCGWLTRKDGRIYRLPTEAEWEYACRAGTQTPYLTGTSPSQTFQIGNVADAALHRAAPQRKALNIQEDSYAFTAPFGRFQANSWGFYDMVGNVWEWCLDFYTLDSYRHSPELDPRGPASSAGHVIRGSGWDNDALNCTIAERSGVISKGYSNSLGFRVARVAAEP